MTALGERTICDECGATVYAVLNLTSNLTVLRSRRNVRCADGSLNHAWTNEEGTTMLKATSNQAYLDQVKRLEGTRHGAKKVGNNTYLERLDDEQIGLRLHSTYVVRWFSNGRIQLESNGWHTATTKERIDSWLPSGLRLATDSDRGWAVYRLRAKRPNEAEFHGYGFDGRRYFDGMVIDEDGRVLNPDERPTRSIKTESGW